MNAATRTSDGRHPHGRHRSARRPHGNHPHGAYRLRLVLSALLLAVGLAPAVFSRFASSTQRAGDHAAAGDGVRSDPALVVHQAASGTPMLDMPGAQAVPGPPVPRESPLYPTPPGNDAALTAADRDFLVRVRQAGLWEGPAGQQAGVRSRNPLVKEAGQHLIAGHAELDAKVLAIGRQLGVDLPSQPSDAQRGWLAEMAAAPTPQDFDRVLANRLRAAHGTVFALVSQIRADTRNSIIRAFAQRAMEVVLDHMVMLERTGLVDFSKLPQPALLPGAAQVATTQTSSGPLAAADRDFLVRVRLAGLWEGPSGRLAQQRTGSPRVRMAGQHLIAGHAELDAKVLALGRELGVDLPTEPSRDQMTWLGEMAAASTQQAFDQVFADRLRAAHGTVYAFVAAVRADTGNSAIRAFAQRVMEVVLDHIVVLERTGLVRYAALPLPPSPTPAAAAPAGGARRSVPSGSFRYLLASMLLVAMAVTVVARRDLVHRST
jgi:predicted outer membrane protein